MANRINGQKGGRPKKHGQSSGLFGSEKKPKKPDKDKDKVKVNEKYLSLSQKIIDFFPEDLKPQNKMLKDKWVNELRHLIEIDGLVQNEILKIVNWGRSDDFWKSNFLSLLKLRKKNKEGIPYWQVFKQKMNGHKSKDKFFTEDKNELSKWESKN